MAEANGRCCTNPLRPSHPQPQARLCHSDRLRTAQLCESIEDGGSDVQFVDLALERSGHHPFAQPFDAIYLGLHQTASVVAAPAFPDLTPESPACGDSRITVRKDIAFAHPGILSRGDDGRGASLNYGGMHLLRVISAITREAQQGLTGRKLCQQLRQGRSIINIVACDADSPYLQCLGINADVQLAPLALAFSTVFFAFPFTFSQEPDACRVDKQMQPA